MKTQWRSVVMVLAVLGLLADPASAADDDVPPEVMVAVKSFFRALQPANEKELRRWITTPASSKSLLGTFKLNISNDKWTKAVEGVRVSRPPFYQCDGKILPPDPKDFPVGTNASFTVVFNETLFGLPMLKGPDGWKVDERFFLASKTEYKQTDPEMVAKHFLFSLFQKDRTTLASLLTSSGPAEMDMLMEGNDFPGGDLDVIIGGAMEMPMVRAHPGEVFLMPSRRAFTATSSADTAVVIGMYGVIALPFELRKIDGTWRVVPEPYVVMLRGLGII